MTLKGELTLSWFIFFSWRVLRLVDEEMATGLAQ